MLYLRPFGIDLLCIEKKFLVYSLVERNLKIKYRQSVLGFLWSLIVPLTSAVIYYFVFNKVFKIKEENYIVFILAGSLSWTFFTQSLTEGTESIVGNWAILSKVPVPIQLFPFVAVLTNFVNFLLTLPILIFFALLAHIPITSSIIVLPLYLFLLSLICYSLAIIFGIALVYLRDIRHFLTIGLQLLFFLTPVVYEETMIPERYRWMIFFNPIALFLSEFRQILLKGEWIRYDRLFSLCLWTIALILLALRFQKSQESRIVEKI